MHVGVHCESAAVKCCQGLQRRSTPIKVHQHTNVLHMLVEMSTHRSPHWGLCCPDSPYSLRDAAEVAALIHNRSTEYSPLIRWLRSYTGDVLFPLPQSWLPSQLKAAWAYNPKALRKASGSLHNWIPSLIALAAGQQHTWNMSDSWRWPQVRGLLAADEQVNQQDLLLCSANCVLVLPLDWMLV